MNKIRPTIEQFESFKIEGNDVKGGFTLSAKMSVSGNTFNLGGLLGKTAYNYSFQLPNNLIGSSLRWMALLFNNRGFSLNLGGNGPLFQFN